MLAENILTYEERRQNTVSLRKGTIKDLLWAVFKETHVIIMVVLVFYIIYSFNKIVILSLKLLIKMSRSLIKL
jgi:hypothetical protein